MECQLCGSYRHNTGSCPDIRDEQPPAASAGCDLERVYMEALNQIILLPPSQIDEAYLIAGEALAERFRFKS